MIEYMNDEQTPPHHTVVVSVLHGELGNSLIRFQPVILTELANSLLVNYEATCELTNICSFTPRVQLYSLVSHRARAVSGVYA